MEATELARVTPVYREDDVVQVGTAAPISLDDLFVSLSRRVYNYAFFHVKDPATADDIVSLVFERVFRNLSKFNPKRSRAADWIFAIAANAVRDHFRALKRGRFVSLDTVGDLPSRDLSPADSLVNKEMSDRLMLEIERLGNREREIVALKFAGGLSNKSIARICRIRPGNVAVILYRAIGKLREEIVTQEEGK
jgi:RNA polymerase sigma factor (sigma-70 family)